MAAKETHAERAERMKIFYDMNKHLSTLATGTTVILSAMLEKLFGSSNFKWVAIISFVFLGISLLGSIWGMFGFAAYSRSRFNGDADSTSIGVWGFIASMICFCISVVVFMIFSGLNFIVN